MSKSQLKIYFSPLNSGNVNPEQATHLHINKVKTAYGFFKCMYFYTNDKNVILSGGF